MDKRKYVFILSNLYQVERLNNSVLLIIQLSMEQQEFPPPFIIHIPFLL